MSATPPQYTPQYGATGHEAEAQDNQPLLGGNSTNKLNPADIAFAATAAQASGSRNAWMDQPAEDDIPDDFKIGVVVMDCDEAIRRAFIRKVYAILLVQLALTVTVAGTMMLPGPKEFIMNNTWIIWTSLVGSFASLFGVYWKRHDYPANMIVLALFTFFESIMIGTSCTMLDNPKIVVQALAITVGVFIGLTLFTFQTKFDFTSFAPFLFAGLMGLITTGFIGIFMPFNQTFDLIVACGGVLLFSGFILYDTQQIMKRLSVDEAILGALSLYLDFLNLFLSVLRILNNQSRD